MISTSKATYLQLLSQQELPLFYQDWYLDAACGGSHWTPYILTDEKDQPVAGCICNTKTKAGLTTSLQPQLTPYSGLFVLDPNVQPESLEQLMQAVTAKHHIVVQDFHPSSPSLTGCTQKRTFIISPQQSIEKVYAAMKSSYRRTIKKAKEHSTVTTATFDQFSSILELSFKQKGTSNPFPMDVFSRIDTACSHNRHRTIIGIADSNGQLQGAAYFMHDSYSWYYMGGAALDIKNGIRYLLALGIEHAIDQGLAFDFEGSTIPSIAQFFKGFGGVPVDYSSFTYTSGLVAKIALSLKQKLG